MVDFIVCKLYFNKAVFKNPALGLKALFSWDPAKLMATPHTCFPAS